MNNINSKKLVPIIAILIVIAATVSSIGSFSVSSYTNSTETVAPIPDVFNIVKISEGDLSVSRTECGVHKLSVKPDGISKSYTNGVVNVSVVSALKSVNLQKNITSLSIPLKINNINLNLYIKNTSYASNVTPLGTATLNGVVQDEYENPVYGAVVKWTDCSDNLVTSDTTNIDGEFSLTASDGSYKLKVTYNSITYLFYINGEECPYYAPGTWTLNDPLTITTKATLNGVVQDEYENPVHGATVKWTDCNDDLVTSDGTNIDGEFSLTALAGNYKLKVTYNGITYPFSINGEECPYYAPGVYTLTNPLTITTNATLNGAVQDEDENPVQWATVKWTHCNDTQVTSNITNSTGWFSLTAPPGSYKLKVTHNNITYFFIINDEECPYYARGIWTFNSPLTIRTRTTLHGYIKDLDNNPLDVTVELCNCSSDTLIASDDTNSTGYFSVTADAGHYKIFINVTESYRIKIVGEGDNDCFLLIGDADLGTMNIPPTPDCSVYNYKCYGPDENIKLFNCYWDDGCWCYGQECACGCTDGLPECDPCDVGTIHVDVDNINDCYNPLSGARVHLDGEYKGTTDSIGKKEFSAGYGYREVRVECPDESYCDTKTRYVDSADEYMYFDCGCIPDSDDDGFCDSDEILLGTDPIDPSSTYTTAFAYHEPMVAACLISNPLIGLLNLSETEKQNMEIALNGLNAKEIELLNEGDLDTLNNVLDNAGVSSEKIVQRDLTLRESLRSCDSIEFTDSGHFVLLTDDSIGVTDIFSLSATCQGYYAGLFNGAKSGAIDDINFAIDVVSGIIYYAQHLREILGFPQAVYDFVFHDFPALAGMTDTLAHDVIISILEKGEEYNPYKGNDDEYLAFQVGFFSGHGVGYIGEQLLAGKGIGTATKSAKITKYGTKYASLGAKFADELRDLKLAIKALDEASTFGKVTKGIYMGSEEIVSLGGKLTVTTVSYSKAVVKDITDELGDIYRRYGKNFDNLASTAKKGEFGEHCGRKIAILEYGDDSLKYYNPSTGRMEEIIENAMTSSKGIDIIACDGDGVWHLIEVKFRSEKTGNMGLNILAITDNGRQMSEEWIEHSLKMMKEGEGGYPKIKNREVIKDLEFAIENTPEKVKREVLIVQPIGKSLPTQSLINYEDIDKIHMIKFDEDVLIAEKIL